MTPHHSDGNRGGLAAAAPGAPDGGKAAYAGADAGAPTPRPDTTKMSGKPFRATVSAEIAAATRNVTPSFTHVAPQAGRNTSSAYLPQPKIKNV